MKQSIRTQADFPSAEVAAGESATPATDTAVAADEAAAPEAANADAVFGLLLQLVRRVESGMKQIDSSHGLSGSQLWALWHVSAQPGLRIIDMAAAMQIHHSTASNLLDKLEARQLIRRERQTQDSRVVRLWLTPAGETLAANIPGPMQGRMRLALQHLSRPERARLSTSLTRILAQLDR